MRFNGLIGSLALTLAALAAPARGQGVFGGGATAFDPQIQVVNSGALLDSTATVSHDMKYVTITARPSVSQLVAIRQFQILIPANLGFVGSQALQQVAMRERGVTGPRAALPTPSPLDRRGITKID